MSRSTPSPASRNRWYRGQRYWKQCIEHAAAVSLEEEFAGHWYAAGTCACGKGVAIGAPGWPAPLRWRRLRCTCGRWVLTDTVKFPPDGGWDFHDR